MAWYNKNRDFIAVGLAAVMLLVFEFALRLPPLYAFGLAAAIWLGVWLVLAPRGGSDKLEDKEKASKVASKGHPSAAVLQTARRTFLELEALQVELKAAGAPDKVLSELASILSDCQAMLREASTMPDDFRHDRRALLHFLPQVVALLRQYQEGLAQTRSAGPSTLAANQRLEDMLERLAALFNMFRRRKAERATRALNVQIDVLEAQLRQEGLATKKDDGQGTV